VGEEARNMEAGETAEGARMRKALLLMLPVAWLAACTIEVAAPADGAAGERLAAIGDTVRLAVGQTAHVGGTGIRITFRDVAADSRCPVDADCVWEGNAEVRLEVRAGNGPSSAITLHTALEPRSARFAEHTIRLIGVMPVRTVTDNVKPADYSVVLRVTR
jgi:hypothetical protein